MLLMVLVGGGEELTHALRVMSVEGIVLVLIEILAIALYLYSAFQIADMRESTERILANRAFVIGYFILGLAVPLGIMWLVGYRGGSVALATLGAVLGLLGGAILRWAVLTAGTMPSWHVAGFEFRRIARPKEPKPAMGLMPPQ
jgi:formate-dependent nitrite reductase membrane component NrfD